MSADIEIDQVTKLYGTFRAVDDVSLKIQNGSFISLLGSSGAGKSTILRMIGGFELPDYGAVRIGGKDVTLLPPYSRDVNTVFQNYALFPHMNVAENVAYGLRRDGIAPEERRRRVREALDMVEMLSYAERRPTQLSGGQQQRVALARAIVKRPSVLLLDEPLGALDRKLRQQMQVELKLLQRQLGLTFVFVTHDQEEALAMSDQIAVMRHGKIEQLGGPTELYDMPSTAFVASFIGTQNFLVGARVDSTTTMRSEGGANLTVGRVVGDLQSNAQVLGAVRPENVMLSMDEPKASANRLRATVAASVMLGDTLEFILMLDGGREFMARMPRRGAELLPSGAEVWAHWEVPFFTMYPYEDLQAKPGMGGVQ
ncbi:ABC transporter ATP-binding protein [Mesorhizobium silamurunense]|uniref:ABC transporter ATP-binding protein n=1 Tax=Mesorhizobium silamurunense TaxID=499528 RepID=UPI001786179D|nr:ABC transporter ATP-binding protein [Mesorhizobium silamurunense]